MSLNDEIQAIRTDEVLSYDEKLKRLQKLVTKAEALIVLGDNPADTITLRDPLGGHPCCRKPLYLIIERVYFDQILAGEKKEEYRFISDGNINRLTYRHEGRRYLKPYDRIRLCVGYHRGREEALVEVNGISFDVGVVTYKLGRILSHKKKE